MTPEEALAKMTEIDAQVAKLRDAHSRYNLIAAGTIETQGEIDAQQAKADLLVNEVNIELIKEAKDAGAAEPIIIE